ncbi:hypothetical protein [Halarcobacter sp.]|uniref:hypothetical protein n=1 Tax=Halarcobacter sp. TaxID=2321133 RepID=UPI0029F56495|nr:hypothetical protein [Halarcobacter sp.]
MSMTLSVVEFKKENGQLQANYISHSKDVIVTEYINSFISEEYISEFSVFEDDEEVIYRELDLTSVKSLSPEVDKKEDNLLTELKKTSGKSMRDEILNNLQDIVCLNRLIKQLLLMLSNKSCIAKLIIS